MLVWLDMMVFFVNLRILSYCLPAVLSLVLVKLPFFCSTLTVLSDFFYGFTGWGAYFLYLRICPFHQLKILNIVFIL